LGLALGIADVLLTVRQGDQLTTALLQAFSSRFTLGLGGATVSLPWHPVITGILGVNPGAGGGRASDDQARE
jgi:hypothetical protein